MCFARLGRMAEQRRGTSRATSHRKQVFEVEGEVRKIGDEERLALLEILERAIGINELNQALFGVDPHLNDAALLVILMLALNFAWFVAGRMDFKGDVWSEVSHDGELRIRKPRPPHQGCVG